MLGAMPHLPARPHLLAIRASHAGAYPTGLRCVATSRPAHPITKISIIAGVNPLQTTEIGGGIVSGRVALLLRSAEIQPSSSDLFGRPPNSSLGLHTRGRVWMLGGYARVKGW